VEQVAQVYARSLFEVASERGVLDAVRDELAEFTDALASSRELKTFFFAPYFSTAEKKDGLGRLVSGADPTFMSFLETLVERHRLPEIFRIRERYTTLWDAEMKLLPVEVTSAVELDAETVRAIGERIGSGTGNRVQVTSVVDPDLLGGISLRVGNVILDASIRNKLNLLRKQVRHARLPSFVKESPNAD
jgi:F-type H+-transporting ATPase subunit delta